MYTYNTRECGDDLTAVSYGRPHCREPTFWCLTMGALRRDPRRGGESINRSGSNSVPSDKGVWECAPGKPARERLEKTLWGLNSKESGREVWWWYKKCKRGWSTQWIRLPPSSVRWTVRPVRSLIYSTRPAALSLFLHKQERICRLPPSFRGQFLSVPGSIRQVFSKSEYLFQSASLCHSHFNKYRPKICFIFTQRNVSNSFE